ncbi:gastrula zinc finger protein XlCGF48.2-like isoform 4-T4 [Leptodactylus fuscus]|uniref:gastrula zinc finger protein XlCGF48.2-like isoform X2 n=1 Tax=Leptodactylus fuscus TaxID=238119 RepID=UPI003F4E7112
MKTRNSESLKMDRGHMTERILNLTLEIIYLLTGEDYIPARSVCDDVKYGSHVPGRPTQARSSITKRPDEKILDLTHKILELLSGEVPIRCQDVSVYFSMEEWEYIEGHKDLHKDIIMEDPELLVQAERPQSHVTDDDDGQCDGESESIIPNDENPCRPDEHLALDGPSHCDQSITYPVAETNPTKMAFDSIHVEVGLATHEKRHREDLESYSSSQPLASEYSSRVKEESSFIEDHYEDSCVFTPAGLDGCEYSYITEDDNVGVSGSTLTVMTCSDCGDRFTIESDDVCFERLQPYRCRKCWSYNSGANDRGLPIAAASEPPRTSNYVSEDYEKGNIDRKRSFASRKLLENKKVIRRKKACSYPKWGGYSEDSGTLNSYNTLPEAFICSHCGKCFNHLTSLELHQKTHMVEKASFISQNGKYFRNKALLKSHQLGHTGGKQYNCSECGKSFKRSLSLVEHTQLHTGERNFTCPDCGLSFTQRTAYVNHHKLHQAGKLHFCFECGKSFRTKADLTTHQRIHMGETPFPCPQCGESFTRRANLVRHQRIHTGEKPFSCPDCGKRFTRKLGLMKHQKIHSGEKIYERGYRKNPFSCTVW